MWQDQVMLVCCFVFTLALIPAVFAKEKPPHSSCFITALGLSIFTFTTYSLELYLTAIGNASTALLWWILLIQKRRS
jgi:hypothetical protein